MTEKTDCFTADNRDKIRKAHASGKRGITLNKIKFVFEKAKRAGYILVKPADNTQVPMAYVQTKAGKEREEAATRNMIAEFQRDKA